MSLALILAACSSGSSSPAEGIATAHSDDRAPGASSPEPIEPTTDSVVETLPSEDSTEEAVGEIRDLTTAPIDAFFGSPTDRDTFMAQINEMLGQRAAYMTRCIRSDGFDFFTEPPEVRGNTSLDTTTWTGSIADGGYGAAMTLETMIALRSNGAPATDQDRQNEAAYLAMSEAEQAAFNDLYPLCLQESRNAHPELQAGSTPSDELLAEIKRVREEIAEDSSFDAIWKDWADCMATNGYEFPTRTEAAQSVFDQINPIRLQIESMDPAAEVPEDTLIAIDRLSSLELELSSTDIRCAADVDLDQRLRMIQFGLELEAIELNGDRWSLLRSGD